MTKVEVRWQPLCMHIHDGRTPLFCGVLTKTKAMNWKASAVVVTSHSKLSFEDLPAGE